MAVQVDVAETAFGVPFAAAYFRIFRVEVSRREYFNETHCVIIDIHGYATKPPSSIEELREIQQRRYAAPLSEIEAQQGGNFLSKCYVWVMAQQDMQGSVPV